MDRIKIKLAIRLEGWVVLVILGRLVSWKGLGQIADGEGCKIQLLFQELHGHLSLLHFDLVYFVVFQRAIDLEGRHYVFNFCVASILHWAWHIGSIL